MNSDVRYGNYNFALGEYSVFCLCFFIIEYNDDTMIFLLINEFYGTYILSSLY